MLKSQVEQIMLTLPDGSKVAGARKGNSVEEVALIIGPGGFYLDYFPDALTQHLTVFAIEDFLTQEKGKDPDAKAVSATKVDKLTNRYQDALIAYKKQFSKPGKTMRTGIFGFSVLACMAVYMALHRKDYPHVSYAIPVGMPLMKLGPSFGATDDIWRERVLPKAWEQFQLDQANLKLLTSESEAERAEGEPLASSNLTRERSLTPVSGFVEECRAVIAKSIPFKQAKRLRQRVIEGWRWSAVKDSSGKKGRVICMPARAHYFSKILPGIEAQDLLRVYVKQAAKDVTPLLLLYGREDGITPSDPEFLTFLQSKGLDHLRIEEVAAGAHFLMLEHPALFTKIVFEFIGLKAPVWEESASRGKEESAEQKVSALAVAAQGSEPLLALASGTKPATVGEPLSAAAIAPLSDFRGGSGLPEDADADASASLRDPAGPG